MSVTGTQSVSNVTDAQQETLTMLEGVARQDGSRFAWEVDEWGIVAEFISDDSYSTCSIASDGVVSWH